MTAAETSSRPVHSQGLLLIAVTVGILILAAYLTQSILENENGGISATVRTIGICLAILAFVRPKMGLYIVSVEAFTVDFIKKVAVYYGTVSTGTIIEVLVVTMLALLGTIVGIFIQSAALRRYKIVPLNWAILIGAVLISLGVLLASVTDSGLEKAAENSFNAGVYIALALPITILLTDREELNKLLRVQFWFAVIWAAWGIRQYYVGFTQLEWFYAETGLSSVATEHMLKFANPRPFGFGSGVPNYGVISPYFIYGLWHVAHYRRKRMIYLLGALALFWGLVTSQQRTALVFPLFALVFYYCFHTWLRTVSIYVTAAVTFVLGVIYCDYLLDHLYDINDAISFFKGDWAENTITVGTFSARLGSWENLKSPATYSLFGNHLNVDNHDVFTRIIISYGVVGLVAVIAASIWLLVIMHRMLLRIEDPEDRKFATFLLAVTIPYVGLGFAGGGNFTTNPINLQMWTFFGAAVSLVIHSKLIAPVSKPSLAAIREMLAQQAKQRNALTGVGQQSVTSA